MPRIRKHRPTLSLRSGTSAPHQPTPATSVDYPQFAQRLRERRKTLRKEIHETLLRADAERYADIADRINDIEDRPLAELLAEVSHADVARDLEEAGDIEMALQRIAAGTYGTCLECRMPIPQERLAAYPTAKRCLPCQQRYEHTRGLSPTPKL